MSIDGEDLGDRYSVGLIQDIALTAESIYASCTKPKIDQTFVEKLSNLKDKVVSFMFWMIVQLKLLTLSKAY